MVERRKEMKENESNDEQRLTDIGSSRQLLPRGLPYS